MIARGTAPFGDRHLEVLADRGPGIRVVSGGYGSGKTSLGVGFVLDVGLRAGHDGPVLGTEPSYRSVADVMERSTMRYLDEWKVPYRHWKADHIFEIGRRKRFEFWCRSLDKPRSVEGINAVAYWGDEWELCDTEALIPAMQRVRAGSALEIMLTGTPEGFGAAYDLILANPSPTTRQYVIRTRDNPFLPPSYEEESRRRLGSDDLVMEKMDGVRTAKGGRVYSRFSRGTHCGDPVVKPGHGAIQIACDFNVRYMHWLVLEVDTANRVAHVVGEVIKEGGTTTDEHAARTQEWIAQYLTRTRGHRYTVEDVRAMKIKAFCDASGTSLRSTSALSDVHLLIQAGFKPQHGTANPRVADRVNTLQVLFRDRRITVDKEAAPRLVRCLETQGYDKAGEPDKAGNIDHGIDALGYLAHWQWPVHIPRANRAAPTVEHDEWGPVL